MRSEALRTSAWEARSLLKYDNYNYIETVT